MSLPQLQRVRWAVRASLVLGVVASLVANVLYAQPDPVHRVFAAWPSLVLVLNLQLLTRVPVHRVALAVVRIVAAGGMAGIAAWVSYWHLVALASRYEEIGISRYLVPLSVDGLVVVASLCLVELSGRIRAATTTPGDAPAADRADAPEPASASAAPAQPDLFAAAAEDRAALPSAKHAAPGRSAAAPAPATAHPAVFTAPPATPSTKAGGPGAGTGNGSATTTKAAGTGAGNKTTAPATSAKPSATTGSASASPANTPATPPPATGAPTPPTTDTAEAGEPGRRSAFGRALGRATGQKGRGAEQPGAEPSSAIRLAPAKDGDQDAAVSPVDGTSREPARTGRG